ncbi:hypothetical protein Aph02nite_71290 [Actinoplanes philippinensis]|uniref:Ig-like domain (Group 3) n=1 Tax=Actinoplanes philippinensis TaxID=35752 RepID=A0A1I2JZK9_9ACTN|nr:Ig-like domain-containing protein [Actinoplanes philippinensis]GIE81179.1 hypothetical protein Aph02nite_71290 [Actinoplanes philippinensis]SFF59593.1 hypothetical protein SAMN05421541_114183 [Actinoplanes philippinensis]
MRIRRLAAVAAISGSLILASGAPVMAADPLIVSTGLSDGQLIGSQTTVFPRLTTDLYRLTRLEVLIDGTVRAARTNAEGPLDRGITFQVPAEYHGRTIPVTIRGTDFLGVTDELATSVEVDAEAPSLSDFGPPAGSVVPGVVTFTPTGLSSDVAKVAVVQSPYPNEWPASEATAAPWTVTWDNRQIRPGSASVTIRVTDRAGNHTDYVRGYEVENRAPDIYFESSDVVGPGRSDLAMRVLDDTGVARVEWWIDGVLRSTQEAITYDFGTRSRYVPVLFKAWDTVGNLGTWESSVTVDASGPAVTWLSPSSGAYLRSRQIVSRVSAADPHGILYAHLQGGSPVRIVQGDLEAKVNVRADGRRELVWEVMDRMGNSTVVRRTVTVDTLRPTLKVTKAPKNKAKVKGTVKVTASASDKYGVARVELLINGKVVAKDYKAGYAFSINTKKYGKKIKFQLRAYDRAGNVQSISTRTWYR